MINYARMTAVLELTVREKVLEVVTGSSYQVAILADLTRRLISKERLPSPADSARKLLSRL